MRYQVISDFNSLDSIEFTPTVAICFYIATEQKQMLTRYHKLKSRFKDIAVIGSSGYCTLTRDPTHNTKTKNLNGFDLNFDQKSVWMLLELDVNAIKIVKMADMSLSSISSDTEYSGILLSSQASDQVQQIIKDLEFMYGIKNIFGAISSSDSNEDYSDGELFINGSFEKSATILLLLDNSIYKLTGQSMHDFEPVGLELTITNAKECTIYEIENRPALEILESVIGPINQEDIDSFAYPLAIYNAKDGLECESKGGVISSIKKKSRSDMSITMYKSVHAGDKLKISIPLTLKEQKTRVLSMLKNLKEDEQGIFFWFVCIGVEKYYGEMERVFLLRVSKALEKGLIGFYSTGELGCLDSGCSTALQNQTVTYVSLSRRREQQ